MKFLGIDYGESKIGLAIGDTEAKIASPFSILKNKGWNASIKSIKEICLKEKIGKIIIGVPKNLRGPSQEQAEKTKKFIAYFRENIEMPVEEEDEQFTTAQARKLSTKGDDDDLAAMLILQGYLDKQV